jgi:hypothetical protein
MPLVRCLFGPRATLLVCAVMTGFGCEPRSDSGPVPTELPSDAPLEDPRTDPPSSPADDDLPPQPGEMRAGWYVSAGGSSGGSGTPASPWTLASVLDGSRPVAPGDTVWVRGGTYRGEFVSRLTGTRSRPIIVRQYPGERATIDGNLVVYGGWVTFWGLEVMNSNPLGNNKMGINNRAPGSRFVNLVVHDHGMSGLGIWSEGPEAEVYGTLAYNNGTHGNLDHGIYAQNSSPVKRIADNLIFNNLAYGLHIYSSAGQSINNFLIEGNVAFNNGTIGSHGWRPDLFVGGETAATGITVRENYTWRNDGLVTANFGWYWGPQNGSLVLTDNYFVGGLDVRAWTSLTQSGNTTVDPAARPGGHRVVVRPNEYERGRAHVIVYNWDRRGSTSVDLGRVLQPGDRYEIRNAQQFYGTPVAYGTYSGGSVSIPLGAVSSPTPIGRSTVTAPTTGPDFQVYVVVRVEE